MRLFIIGGKANVGKNTLANILKNIMMKKMKNQLLQNILSMLN